MLWDTLKAFLRGVLIQQMAKFNKEARSEEEGTLRDALEAENNFIRNPTPELESTWQEKQQKYKLVVMQKVETRRLLQRQEFMVEGEKEWEKHWLCLQNQMQLHPRSSLLDQSGDITSSTPEIVQAFRVYYKKTLLLAEKG